jgi:hypothetical protein
MPRLEMAMCIGVRGEAVGPNQPRVDRSETSLSEAVAVSEKDVRGTQTQK